MGLLQKIQDAYNGGKNAAIILDKIITEEIVQGNPGPREKLITLMSEVESYLQQDEKRENYSLLQKLAYNLAFKFSF